MNRVDTFLVECGGTLLKNKSKYSVSDIKNMLYKVHLAERDAPIGKQIPSNYKEFMCCVFGNEMVRIKDVKSIGVTDTNTDFFALSLTKENVWNENDNIHVVTLNDIDIPFDLLRQVDVIVYNDVVDGIHVFKYLKSRFVSTANVKIFKTDAVTIFTTKRNTVECKLIDEMYFKELKL